MDIRSGNTFRKVPDYYHRGGRLCISSENPEVQQMEIFNNLFTKDLPYSIKKRKRWLISTIQFGDLRDENGNMITDEQPITYSISQYQKPSDIRKANYVFDSISGKEYGSRDISARGFNGITVNYNSLMNELKLSGKESNTVDKGSKSVRNKKSLKNQTLNRNDIIEMSPNEDLKENLFSEDRKFSNVKNREDCVYLNEYMYINNPLTANPSHPWRAYNRQKKHRRDMDDYMSDKDSYNDEIDEDQEEVIDHPSPRKPFVITQDDLLFRNESNIPKKRKKRKSHKPTQYINEEETSPMVVKDQHFEFIPDNLPLIYIEQSYETLLKDIRSVFEFHRCWFSNTLPGFILINLEELECEDPANFLALKPLNLSEDNLIHIKVIFNMEKFDFDEIQQKKFDSLQNLIIFLQEKLEPQRNLRSVSETQFWKLDQLVEKLVNTWNITKMKINKPVFCFNEEWESHELDVGKLEEIININELSFTPIEKCEICLNHFTREDVILMNDCQHRACEACVGYYLGQRLECKDPYLHCTINNCRSTFDCATILSLVYFKRYQGKIKSLEQQFLERRVSKCHNCNIMTIVPDKRATTSEKKLDYLCNCGRTVCSFCGEKQHWPASCDNMRSHNKQIVKLDDIGTKPVIPKKRKSKGSYCPNCGYFAWNKRHFSICGTPHSDKCWMNDTDSTLLQAFIKYNSCPEPDTLRPKFYCESMNVKLLVRNMNAYQLRQKLMKIDTKLKDLAYLFEDDHKIVLAQYFQILSIVESIYISIYQLNRKDNPTIRNVLISSAKTLMFHIHRFGTIIDELDNVLTMKNQTKLKNSEILKKREEINICLNTAINYVAKLYILLN